MSWTLSKGIDLVHSALAHTVEWGLDFRQEVCVPLRNHPKLHGRLELPFQVYKTRTSPSMFVEQKDNTELYLVATPV